MDMALPKFDYDGDEFYNELYTLALQGMTDREIAEVGLKEKFNTSLRPEVFCTMKNGTYSGWTDEENARRGDRISKVLAQARSKITSIVRGRYLKVALGGIIVSSTQTKKVRMADGTETGAEEIYRTETELPPSTQALATWLRHHDPEWREHADTAQETKVDMHVGVPIRKWIEENTE